MSSPWAVNDDVENEFRYWTRELMAALQVGAVFALATGVLIALLPRSAGHPGMEFARDYWPYLLEAAFWLGMLLAMLWSAGKRMGSALSGLLPWQAPSGDRAGTGRFFGQWAAFAALVGFCVWLALEVSRAAAIEGGAALIEGLMPLAAASTVAAALFALVSVACRARPIREKAARPGEIRERR